MDFPQFPHLKMHRCSPTPLKNLFFNAFPKPHFIISPCNNNNNNSFVSSYLTSLQLTPSTPQSHPPIKRKNAPRRKWDKEKLRRYSEKLRDCASNRSVVEGKAVHKQIMESGIELDSHLWVSLINFYAKCGCLSVARQVFDEMPQRDVVSWTALLSGFVGEGCGTEGLLLFRDMLEEGIRPNEFTFATVMKACCVCLNLKFGCQLHGQIVKSGFFSDGHVGSALVDLYAKCGELEYAEKVCHNLPAQNAASWNSLLNGFALLGDDRKVLRLFSRMKEAEMKFNKYTLCTILKGCASSGNLKTGQLVHGMAIVSGCQDEEFVSCSLVDMYSKCGMADDALKVFWRIKYPDIVTWSAMICCLEQQGREEKAAELFCLMMSLGLTPNQFTLTSIVSAAKNLGDVYFSQCLHACVHKYGFAHETVVCNALITMYMKNGSFDDGFKIFNSMSQRDLVSWNGVLSGFHDSKSCDGLRIFREMLVNGLKPNMYTFISTLRSCTSLSNREVGKQVHAHVIKDSLGSDCYVGTALIDMYVKSKCMKDAEKIVNRLDEIDLFTWTTIISGCAQNDQGEKSIHYFKQMHKDGVKPNEFTLAGCLRGCSGIASLKNGRQLHSFVIKDGHVDDPFVVSALVDMYGKCGCIDDAEMIFEDAMESHDTVLWNTIINQYSQHDQGEKALRAFESMLTKGVLPDGVTFIGILSACSHLGLVEVGRKHFNSMSEVYGILPSIEHYACMVDILGRAGRFNEVEILIDKMEPTPNSLIWETLLGACKIHGNVELGEKVAKILFQIEPEVDSNYIMLSNIYAAKGMWDEVAKIRALMSHQGIKKEPGCSWVEVDTQTHVFLSQDTSHKRILEVHQKLEEVEERLLSVGYIPNTDYVLHNVSDSEKRKILSRHSERLALGFSLINDNSNKVVRIFKNLRICGDCHEYMKLVSSITNKDIVIRDAKRFHHFQDGACSCRDYW